MERKGVALRILNFGGGQVDTRGVEPRPVALQGAPHSPMGVLPQLSWARQPYEASTLSKAGRLPENARLRNFDVKDVKKAVARTISTGMSCRHICHDAPHRCHDAPHRDTSSTAASCRSR